MISAQTQFCIIIGDPVSHSLSPAMHNAAYIHLGIDNKFVYLGSNVKITDVKKVVESMRAMSNFRGLTCTVPHKIEVMKYLDWIDPIAKKIGAVNSVVNDGGILKGYNTDWLGALIPLKKHILLENKKVLVLGAGGAARAVVYALRSEKAHVTITNRTYEKAIELAREFECKPKEKIDGADTQIFDVIINTTSVGMSPAKDNSPLEVSALRKNQVIMDIVYSPYETQFLKQGKKAGATIIHGTEMLLHQGTAQFELYTGVKAPVEVMGKALFDALSL